MWTVAQLRPEPGAAALAHPQPRTPGDLARFIRPSENANCVAAGLQAIEVPVFSGYIFVALNDLRWVPVNSTYGINRLLVRKVPNSRV